jgi:hypothetical protein
MPECPQGGEGQMKLTEQQQAKLNKASELIGEVRAELVRQCVAMPDDDPEKAGWNLLFQLECKLNVLILQMSMN